jgi:hypothetical protein
MLFKFPDFSLIKFCLLLVIYPIGYLFSWDLKQNKDDVQVYTQAVPGSEIVEFRGVTKISAPIEKVYSAILTPSTYPSWMHNCAEAKVLQKVSDTERISFIITKPPWPLQKRESIIRSKLKREGKNKIIIDLQSDPNLLPINPENIRIITMKGMYQISEEGGITEVTYQAHFNPGGNLSPSIINSKVVIDTPYHTLKNLKNFIEAEL